MSVVKSKRRLSNFEVIHHIDVLGRDLTQLMIRNFGVDPFYTARRNYAVGKDRFENVHKYRFIVAEAKRQINKDISSLTYHAKTAYKIWPRSKSELESRRNLQNLALGDCEHIRSELQRVCDVFCVSLSNFRIPIGSLNYEVKLLSGWQKTDRERFSDRF